MDAFPKERILTPYASPMRQAIIRNESLRHASLDIAEGVSPKQEQVLVAENENESWFDRQINLLTAAIGCGPIFSSLGEETRQSNPTPVESTPFEAACERHDQLSSTAAKVMDEEKGEEDLVVLDVFLCVNKTLNQSASSLDQAALNSSSSAEVDSENERNRRSEQKGEVRNEKAITRKPSSDNTERRLCIILGILLLVMGVVLAVFLPDWEGKVVKSTRTASAAASFVTSPSFAPTTGKPTMAPTFGNPAIVLTFIFDDYAEEISWEVTDSSSGMVVEDLSSFTYEPGTEAIIHRIPVEINRQYTLTIFDEGLDGLCCDAPGEYFIMFRGEQLVSGEGNFGAQISHSFTIPDIV